MPRVPTYDQFQVQVSDAAQPRFSSPDMPIVAGKDALALGEGMMKTASAADQYAEKMREEADQLRVIDATNEAVKAQLGLTYDKTNGFLNFKGKQALERPDNTPLDVEYTKKLENQFGIIEEKLGNDRQKKLFRQAAAGIQRQFMASINSHVAAEYKDWQVSVQNSTIEIAGQKMGLDYGNPKVVKEQQRIIGAAQQKRDEQLPEEEREANLIKALSPGNTTVVMSAIKAGDFDYAKKFFEDNKANFTNAARLEIEGQLNVAPKQAAAIQLVDKAVAEFGNDWTKAEQYILDNSRTDPTKLANARAELSHRRSVYEVDFTRRTSQNKGQLLQMIEGNVSWKDVLKSGQYTALQDADRLGSPNAAADLASVKNYFDAHQAELKARASNAPLDLAAYAKIANPEFVTKVAKMNTVDAVAEAKRMFPNNPQMQKHVIDLRFQALNGIETANDKIITDSIKAAKTASDLDYESVNRLVTDRLSSIEINPHPSNSDTAELTRIGAVRQFVQQEVLKEQQRVGHKLTDEEMTKKVNKLFATGIKFNVTGTFGGKSTQVIPMLKINRIKDLPEGAADGIRKALRDERAKQGIYSEPSDTDVLIRYWEMDRSEKPKR